MVSLKPSARVMICQRCELTVWARANSPTPASQNSRRSPAKTSANLVQSIFQATQPRRTALIPTRSNLFTDQQLLFMGSRTQLIKPALLGIHHVDQDAIPPWRRKPGDDECQFHRLSRTDLRIFEAPVFHRQTVFLLVANIDSQPESCGAPRPHVPGDSAGVANANVKTAGPVTARVIPGQRLHLKGSAAALILLQEPMSK